MKKLIAFLLAAIMLLSLCACGAGEQAASQTPLADELKSKAEAGDILYPQAWALYRMLTKNIGKFKDPSSVELTGKVYYCKGDGDGEYKFFLVECRANNSFGGKSVGYVKVTENDLIETNWEPTLISPEFEGESVFHGDTMLMQPAFDEFISVNYGK